jgi:hypothetical protein
MNHQFLNGAIFDKLDNVRFELHIKQGLLSTDIYH